MERVLCIPQSSSITEALPSDSFVSYPGHPLGESYLSAEMQLVYSAAPADWAMDFGVIKMKKYSTFPKVPGLEPHHLMV